MNCVRCDFSGDNTIKENGPHLTQYCGGCGAYMKNLPKEDPSFYFGKYNGKKVKDIDDLSYLEWYLKSIDRITVRMRGAIRAQIERLKVELR